MVGSYLFVLMLDMYMLSGIHYIILNSLRHGIHKDFVKVVITAPFTAKGG